MEIISREVETLIKERIKPQKVIIITGARRVGKTFLLNKIINDIREPHLILNGEDVNTQVILSKRSVENYRQLMGSKKILIIDEAQKIPEIGSILKLIVDELDDIRVLVTGSSAFDLSNKTGEPLTGRKYTFSLFPFSEREFSQVESPIDRSDKVKQRLIFGNYPELIHIPDKSEKKDYLNEIINSYLLKDILVYDNIKYSGKIFNLLRLISYQIGGEVSYNELATQLSMSKNTVEKYLDLLAKVFILFKVEGFSRNLRKEVTKSSKWYFYDNGIRNSIIANFNPVELRNDIGQLWENYIISERLKYQQVKRVASNNFFWRTYDRQEIDWIEEREGNLDGFEFKWSGAKTKVPSTWIKTYPDAGFNVINRDNYFEWLS